MNINVTDEMIITRKTVKLRENQVWMKPQKYSKQQEIKFFFYNNIGCKCSKQSNQKTEPGIMDQKTRSNHVLFTRDTPYRQRLSQALKKVYHADGEQKQAGVAAIISYKVHFRPKLIGRHKEGHFIPVKGIIQQEDIMIVYIYAPQKSVYLCT